MFGASVLTLVLGGFICATGMIVIVKSIVEAYEGGMVGVPFSC